MHQIDPWKFTEIINEADIINSKDEGAGPKTFEKIKSKGDEDLWKVLVYGN